MAAVGRVVPSAATAGLEIAEPFAGRDGGSTTASRFEMRLQGAVGEPIKSREPGLDPDSGTSLCMSLDKSLYLRTVVYLPVKWYLPYWVGLVHSRYSLKGNLFSLAFFLVTLGKYLGMLSFVIQ